MRLQFRTTGRVWRRPINADGVGLRGRGGAACGERPLVAATATAAADSPPPLEARLFFLPPFYRAVPPEVYPTIRYLRTILCEGSIFGVTLDLAMVFDPARPALCCRRRRGGGR